MLIVTLLLASGAGFLPAQDLGPNPYTSSEDQAAGAKLFRTRCAICHGGDARGGRGPDLTRGLFRYGSSDAALYRTIRSGIPQSGMPRLGQSGERVWQLVTFVRSLSRSPVEREVPGSLASGERLFRGKGNCLRCHMLDGRGGASGA